MAQQQLWWLHKIFRSILVPASEGVNQVVAWVAYIISIISVCLSQFPFYFVTQSQTDIIYFYHLVCHDVLCVHPSHITWVLDAPDGTEMKWIPQCVRLLAWVTAGCLGIIADVTLMNYTGRKFSDLIWFVEFILDYNGETKLTLFVEWVTLHDYITFVKASFS